MRCEGDSWRTWTCTHRSRRPSCPEHHTLGLGQPPQAHLPGRPDRQRLSSTAAEPAGSRPHLQGVHAPSVQVQREADEVAVLCHHIWKTQKQRIPETSRHESSGRPCPCPAPTGSRTCSRTGSGGPGHCETCTPLGSLIRVSRGNVTPGRRRACSVASVRPGQRGVPGTAPTLVVRSLDSGRVVGQRHHTAMG